MSFWITFKRMFDSSSQGVNWYSYRLLFFFSFKKLKKFFFTFIYPSSHLSTFAIEKLGVCRVFFPSTWFAPFTLCDDKPADISRAASGGITMVNKELPAEAGLPTEKKYSKNSLV